jgi:hypothetical protein
VVGTLISCSSDDGARHYCAANIRGPVALTRQLSGTPCVEGQSWGYDRGGVWVDRGCSAEFQLSAGEARDDRGPAPVAPPPGPPAPQTITCFSQNNRRQDCPADTRGGVSLARQVGGTPCIEGQSWGYGRSGVWVDRGCRAVFELGAAGPVSPGVPPPPAVPAVVTVTCSSSDGARHFCPADTSSGVTLLRQIGDAACAQNESWGFDRQGIWVNRGCTAVFQVGGGRARQPVY